MNLKVWGACGLKCEGLVNPMGIEESYSWFSWIFKQEGRDKKQTAYRILVSTHEVRN